MGFIKTHDTLPASPIAVTTTSRFSICDMCRASFVPTTYHQCGYRFPLFEWKVSFIGGTASTIVIVTNIESTHAPT